MKIKLWFVSLLAIVSISGIASTVILPQIVYAADDTEVTTTSLKECNTHGFLGFPAWYRGLTNDSCDIVSPSDPVVGGLTNFILRIAMNVIQIALTAVIYLSVAFIMYGGFLYLTSQGEMGSGSTATGAAKAKKTLLNAVIGLVISIVAVAVVNFIMARILNGATYIVS